MKEPSQRQRRVGKLVQRAVSEIIQHEVDDPSIGFVTITDVEISRDMRNATVYYSVLGEPDQVEESTKGLMRARKFINIQLGTRLEMRYTPVLYFKIDETAQRAQSIERVLNDIEQADPPNTQPNQPDPQNS
jgi:ribosome-binding factor A